MIIRANLDPLESVSTFSYLGCTTAFNNSYWSVLYQNMGKSQSNWVMVSWVLVKAGTTVQARVVF